LKPRQINVSAFKNQTISNWRQDRTKESYKGKHYINYWLGNNEGFYIARSSRDLKRIDIAAVSVKGSSRTVLEERSNVYQDFKRSYCVNNGSQFIQWSQRDGWGHVYLYDKNGRMINQITKAEFHCDDLTRYNEATGTLYFKANGKEKNI